MDNTTNTPKPRALFMYDSDRIVDEMHPQWAEIVQYAQKLAELHILVFISTGVPKEHRVEQVLDNVFVYYVFARSVVPRIGRLWQVVRRNLVWKKNFRADFILSNSSHLGSLVGVYLAKRFKKPLFLTTSGTFLELSPYAREYQLLRYVAHHAHMVFVPSATASDMLVARTHISNERIAIIRPAIDLDFLQQPHAFVEYAKRYPQHNLFLLTHTSLAHRRGIALLLKVWEAVIEKYPRTALVVVTPAAQVRHIEHILHQAGHRRYVYVFPESTDIAEVYGGAHILLATSEAEEINMPVVTALGLHIPVVTTPAGVAKELFTGSRYERFMCPFGDAAAFTAAVTTLIEDQHVRDDYRLNSPLLLKVLTLQTKAQYADMLFSSIQESAIAR